MKPVCVPCQRFFRPAKTGYYFIEGMPFVPNAQAGRAEPESWKPYRVWVGDRWECPDCGANIVVGVISTTPLAEHYQDNFESVVKQVGADQLQVNDC